MSDAEKGIAGAHTRGDGGGAAAPGGGEGQADPAAAVTGALGVDAAAADLVRMLEAEAAEQGDLLGDMPDLMPEAARVRIAAKRGRGRPPGAANRRSERMRDYLLRKGFLHPMEALAGLASSTPGELSAALACEPLEAAELIRRAAADLLPYFESKAPVDVRVDRTERHLFLVGSIDAAPPADAGGALNLFGGNVEDYQDISTDTAIRRGDHSSDDDGK